jgi:alpha-L-fucosidase
MKHILTISLLLLFGIYLPAQDFPAQNQQFVRIFPGEAVDSIIKKAAHVTPSKKQMAWQEIEFACFIHFGVNTFTNREWGTKDDVRHLFNPTQLDARQWAKTISDAGAKELILVSKHHDGFCHWPTKFTDYSVKNSPWKNGQGDLVADVAAACKEFGLKFGVYLSPWDIHSPVYGSEAYNEFFKNQLRELLTNYGEIAEVWFDGACGEGPNGQKQVYDWNGYYRLINELQPDAVIAIMGPDVRWVGTESGYGRETEWSVIPVSANQLAEIAASSQQKDVGGAFVPIDMMQPDLGSREKIINAGALMWYPAEVDVSIRPGWFYHENEDSLVKSPEKLVDIYFSSVGRNAGLLLNLPPDKRGLIHENDVKSLLGMKAILDKTFDKNLAENARIAATESQAGNPPESLLDGDPKTFWTTKPGTKTATLEFTNENQQEFDVLLLQENITNGQRIEEFSLEVYKDGEWVELAKGTTIGYKRLLRIERKTALKVRLKIISSRDCPELSEFGLFKSSIPVNNSTETY